jgi:hypothetical protein
MCSTRDNSPAVENEQNKSTFQDPENYRPIANWNHFGKMQNLSLKRVRDS